MTQDDYWATVARETAEKLLHEFESWFGAGRVFSRSELCKMVGCTDSVMRTAIGVLQERGHLVVSVNGGGYRLAQSLEEAQAYIQSIDVQIAALQRKKAAIVAEMALRQRSSAQLELL